MCSIYRPNDMNMLPLRTRFSLILMVSSLVFSHNLQAQTPIDWEDLAQVNFSPLADETARTSGETVQFEAALQELDSQIVEITGYMLPLTADNDRYILSRYPFYNCFFCGNAGRETVIELQPKEEDWEFDIDDKVKIRGKLRLIADPEGLIFELSAAEPI